MFVVKLYYDVDRSQYKLYIILYIILNRYQTDNLQLWQTFHGINDNNWLTGTNFWRETIHVTPWNMDTVAAETSVTEQFLMYISKLLYTISNSTFTYVNMVQDKVYSASLVWN